MIRLDKEKAADSANGCKIGGTVYGVKKFVKGLGATIASNYFFQKCNDGISEGLSPVTDLRHLEPIPK